MKMTSRSERRGDWMYIPANFDWQNPPKKKQSLFIRFFNFIFNQKKER